MLCLDCQVLVQLTLTTKWNKQPYVLVEDIDHTIRNDPFDYLVLSVYSNSCSFFWSLPKCITYSYIHAYVIDFVGTITSIISIKGILIKTHSKLIKKATFYSWNFFLSKANLTMTKDTWIWQRRFGLDHWAFYIH